MPKINAGNMFEDDFPPEIADGTFGSSNKSTLSKAFPQAIHHSPGEHKIQLKDTIISS